MHLPAASGHNGYVLHFTSPGSMADTKVGLLDPVGNTEVARLVDGFTTGAWLKFESVDPTGVQPSFMLNNHE